MVGDAGPDIGVARRAGIPVIGVEFGYTEVPIADLKPDRLINHMSELPAAVESLMLQQDITIRLLIHCYVSFTRAGVNHQLTMMARPVARPVLTLLWSTRGLWQLAAIEWRIMRRVIAIAVAGASLAGCSSLSWDSFKSAPPTVQVQLELGADRAPMPAPPWGRVARPPARSPCPLTDAGFSVTYTLNKFQPATVASAGHPYPRRFLHACVDDDRSQSGGRGTSAGGPAAAGAPGKPMRPKKPKPPKSTTAAPAAGSPVPGPAIAPTGPGTTGPAAAHPLIACTAPDRLRIVRGSHHA